jgi:uncharacterized protein
MFGCRDFYPGGVIHTMPYLLDVFSIIHESRPYSTYHGEIIRWYDHWLKGVDTGLMDEPTAKCWVMGANTWRTGSAWPLPETQWTELYLSSWERLTAVPV